MGYPPPRMGAFYMNEAMFELPEAGFVDRTVTHLEGTSPSGAGVTLLVERHPLPEGKSLRQAAADHVSDEGKRLRAHTVLFQRDTTVGELPAIDIGMRWRNDTGAPIFTRQTHFILGSLWMIVGGEAPMGEREFCESYVDSVLGSLRLRE